MKGEGGKKEKKNLKRGGDERGKDVVTDDRFASVHTDPRFQKIRPKERKVQIDNRFDKMFTDKNFGSSAAPVDKKGRKKEQTANPLKRYYELEKEEESEEEVRVKVGSGLKVYDVDEDGVGSGDESNDMEEMSDVEVDTDDEMLIGDSESESEEQEEEVPEIDQETSRLAAVNLDWHHIKAVDLYVLLNSFLPDGGRIRSVTVYPSEFGMERMKEEAVHGPVGLFDHDGKKSAKKKENDEYGTDGDRGNQNGNEEDGNDEDVSDNKSENGSDSGSDNQNGSEEDVSGNESEDEDVSGNESEDEDVSGNESEDGTEDRDDNPDENEVEEEEEEEEDDEDYIDERVRNYEKTRLRYYFAAICCDSVATANHLYKECDGIEIMQSSNKLDLRYIPDSMEFNQEARDVASEVPSGYTPSNFFTKALQLSKPVLTWDDDEPERATLKRNFNADELEKLEFNEYMASDESDDEDDDGVDNQQSSKKHDKVDAYRSLLLGGGADEDDDSEDDGSQDMEVTFNTGLEDISKRILERNENKSETVWEAHLRKRKEKRKAKKSNMDSDIESVDTDDHEGMDDFMGDDGPALKKHKGSAKTKSNRKGTDSAEVDKEAGASRAELELLLADDKGTSSTVKGYKIKAEKSKRKKGKEDVVGQKIPDADLDDPRFQALFKDPLYSLDPTDPQFKRSVAYRRQLADKEKKAEKDAMPAKDQTRSSNQVEMSSGDIDNSSKPVTSSNGNNAYEISSLVKSIKMKSKEADKRAKSDISAMVQSLKKKTKGLIN